jgi:hypothetical protein
VNGVKLNSNAAASGGGLFNRGDSASAAIVDSTVAGNTAEFSGGGISNALATTTVERSTISGNRAGRSGGGVSALAGTVDLFNCSIVYNLCKEEIGGAIVQFDSTLTIVNCTIVGNADASNSVGGAGGIATETFDLGTINLRNTVIAGNFAAPDSAADNVDLSDLDENTSNFLGGDPRLGPLDLNGGPTQTMAPLAGSPVIDAGDNMAASDAGLTTDQRGLTRIVGGTVDIGAVETQAGEPLPLRRLREGDASPRGAKLTLTAGAYDLDLSFAAALLDGARTAKRHDHARELAFALEF